MLNGNDDVTAEEIYLQKFPVDQKKIFLIGSSQIQPLNPKYIHDDLLKNGLNYTVYNLGIGGDLPKSRMQTVDSIISTNPAMVVFGIGDRDFRIVDSSVTDANQVNLLPNLHDIIGNWLNPQLENFQGGFYFLQSPKLDLLTLIFGASYTHKGVNLLYFDNPDAYAEHFEKNYWPIANDATLKKQSEHYGLEKLLPLENNENFIAFEKMIKKLRDKKIPVVIFVVPQQKYRLEVISNVSPFNLALKNISQKYPDVPIYSLWDRYANLHIWEDISHIVNNAKNTTRLYSDDVAKIITFQLDALTRHSSIQNGTHVDLVRSIKK
jgi:hypothetical protein